VAFLIISLSKRTSVGDIFLWRKPGGAAKRLLYCRLRAARFVFGEDGGDAGEEVDFGELLDVAAFGGDQGEAEAVFVLEEVGALFDA
jgi:hypothetical protein